MRGACLLVLQDFAGLHGAHDGGVDGVAPVAVHVLHHLLPLIRRRGWQLRAHTHFFRELHQLTFMPKVQISQTRAN